jgi:hypothetical protein
MIMGEKVMTPRDPTRGGEERGHLMRGQGITPRHKPWIPGWCPCDGAGVTSPSNDWTKGRHRRGTRAAAQSPAQTQKLNS